MTRHAIRLLAQICLAGGGDKWVRVLPEWTGKSEVDRARHHRALTALEAAGLIIRRGAGINKRSAKLSLAGKVVCGVTLSAADTAPRPGGFNIDPAVIVRLAPVAWRGDARRVRRIIRTEQRRSA